MRQIVLNSMAHYQFRETPDGIELWEYPEECPDMGDRESFREDEGKLIATFDFEEKVEFCNHVITRTVISKLCSIEPICGDDFLWNLRNKKAED